MTDEAAGVGPAAVRAALRTELETRGYRTGSDTAGLGGELYVTDERGLARALFEFKPTAEEAFFSMYQGSWVAGLPPRFVVLPGSQVGGEWLDVLEQARIGVVFQDSSGDTVCFPDLEAALALIGPPLSPLLTSDEAHAGLPEDS
jgi:hypothetical protein